MSTVVVANVDFESTGNNQLVYSSNSVTLRVGGAAVMNANSTVAAFALPVTATGVPPTTFTTNTFAANSLTITSNGSLTVTGQIVSTGTVTPAAIAANTSAFSPPITNEYIVRISANNNVTTPITIYGIAGGVNGQIIVLSNIGTKPINIEPRSVSEATAENRFVLPNIVTLNGYQSMTIYYDGVELRWKAMDTNTPYLLNHKLSLNYGYFDGSPMNRISYNTETSITSPGSQLPIDKQKARTAGNAIKGFFMGGTVVVNACKVTYASQASAAVPGANLTQARSGVMGAGNACKGFFAGGATSCATPGDLNPVTTTCRTRYSNETTAAVPGANLSQARSTGGAAGNACKGFFIGAVAQPIAVATADRITYSTETRAAVPGANLTQTRGLLTMAGNACKGFNGGGLVFTPAFTVVATTDRTNYTTETTAAVAGANLSQARYWVGSAGNQIKGFFSGGTCGAVGVVTSDRTTYDTETTAAVAGANMSTARLAYSAI